jgi:hypothetical protein
MYTLARRQHLQVLLAVKGDGVVGAAPGVHAAGAHVEAQPRVRLHPLIEVGHADHHVVDAREHGATA